MEGVIGISAFIVAMILLALVHGVTRAIQNAQASRQEAQKLVGKLSELVTAVEGKGPAGPGGPAASQRPVKRRRVVAGRTASPRRGGKTPYGPRNMAAR